jgi:DNA/RNA-binding domain of Phe-tRNA-synthetase-like protein
MPLGLYDRDQVQQAVFARMGRIGEGYEGIRKGFVNLSMRPLLADDAGAFGAPTSDSARTQVGPHTRNVLVVVYGARDRAAGDLMQMLERIADLLARYTSAHCDVVRTVS